MRKMHFCYVIIISRNIRMQSAGCFQFDILTYHQLKFFDYQYYSFQLFINIKTMICQSIASLPLRKRSAYTDKYQKTSLITNLYQVKFNQDVSVYIYAFKIHPTIPFDNQQKLKALISNSRKTIENTIGPFVHSGRTLYGVKPCGKLGDQRKLQIGSGNQSFELTMKLVRSMTLADIYSDDKSKSGVVFSFFNSILKSFFNQLNYIQIGRSRKYYDTTNKIHLDGANVMIFNGFSTTFNLLESGLYLKVDPSVKIVRNETVLDIIDKIYKRNTDKNRTEKRLLIQEELVGKMVMANYGKSRYYIIDEILFEVGLDFTFSKETNITLIQYYKQTYNISIQNQKQPLLKVSTGNQHQNNKKEIILIPELCLMSGLPEDFDERKRREVSEHTIVKPEQKLSDIEFLMKSLTNLDSTFNPKSIKENLSIEINTSLTKIQAKILPNPILQLGRNEKVEENKIASFMLFNKPLYSSEVPLRLCIINPQDYDTTPLKSLVTSTSNNIHLEVNMKIFTYSASSGNRGVVKNVEEIVFNQKDRFNMFWVILPQNYKSEYKNIKRLLLKENISRNSQISLVTTLNKKGFASILTKILLQMAAKIGNKLWVPKVSDKVLQSGTMIIGIENYKDCENKNQTVMAFCATINPELSEFYSDYYYQESSGALSTKMRKIITQCLSQYIKKNKKPPQEVIIMKNGSAKFELGLVLDSEIHQIKEALKNIPKSYKAATLTYIVVDKNVSQKFFLQRSAEISNPNFGTLVSTEVVTKFYDFYLIAQNCNRGTAKPAYFKIMFSNSEMEEGVLQEMIYGQCFNYMNWTGPVRVPSVLQYAKKLAMFVAQYINVSSEAETIKENLYFI